jgi:hypothetical protein
MELIEVKSLNWAQKGKLYIIYEKVMRILGILRFKSIHILFYTLIHNKGNNKITELRAILQREIQNP